jgi:hypothetical protein
MVKKEQSTMPAKYWRLYRVGADGKLIQPALAEADTPEELWTIHRHEVYYKWQRIALPGR